MQKAGAKLSPPKARRGETTGWEAEFAALSQQVDGLESDYRDLKGVVVNLDRKMDAQFAALTTKIDSRNVTPWASIWAALGVLLAGMTTVGWLALQPIQSAVLQNRSDIFAEYQRRRDEDRDIRHRLDETRGQLDYLRGTLVPRTN